MSRHMEEHYWSVQALTQGTCWKFEAGHAEPDITGKNEFGINRENEQDITVNKQVVCVNSNQAQLFYLHAKCFVHSGAAAGTDAQVQRA